MRTIVLDSNVLIAGLRSKRGASNKLLSLVGTGVFTSVVSVPLIFEYEDVALRHLEHISYSADEVREIINFVCSMSDAYPIYYLWRPFLPDPGDDHVLELAVAAGCDSIITFNLRDFRGIERFGLQAQTPGRFLKEIHT